MLKNLKFVVVAGDETGVVAEVAFHGRKLGNGAGQIALRLTQIGLHAAHVRLHVAQIAGNCAHLLRGLALCRFKALGVLLLTLDDGVGALVELFLGEAEGLAKFLSSDGELCLGLTQIGGQLDVLLVGISQSGFLVRQPAAQRVTPDEPAQREHQSRSDDGEQSAGKRPWCTFRVYTHGFLSSFTAPPPGRARTAWHKPISFQFDAKC